MRHIITTVEDRTRHNIEFDGLGDFAEFADGRLGTTPAWGDSSTIRSPDRTKFTGVASLEDAIDLARDGWQEGADRLLSGLDTHAPEQPDIAPAWEYDVGGEFPDIGAYCAGVPEHMVSPAMPDMDAPAKAPRLAVLGTCPSTIPTPLVENYAVALASHIQAIQAEGRSVELSLVVSARMEDGDLTVTRIPIINPSAPVELGRLAFAFHPAALRRLWFASMEQIPDVKALGSSYGTPVTPPADDYTAIVPGPWAAHDAGRESVREIADWLGGHLEAGGIIVRDSLAAA